MGILKNNRLFNIHAPLFISLTVFWTRAPEHLVSSVQAAAPHQTLHSEHSGPGEKGGGLHHAYH